MIVKQVRDKQRREQRGDDYHKGNVDACLAKYAKYKANLKAVAMLTKGVSTLFITGFIASAWAQESLPDDSYHRVFTTNYRAASLIDGRSLSNVQGAINVNMASGYGNLQSNSGVIAIGDNVILPSNSGHLKNVIRYDEVNHGKIDNINEEKIIYPLLRWLPARSISAC